MLAYTGQTDPADRERAEQLLKANGVKALVATSALGMGFDKPDLGSSSRWASSQPRRARASGRRSTPRRSDARASGPRMVRTSLPPSCSASSATTRPPSMTITRSNPARSSS
ncbi:hypothetical protein ACC691_36020 [Rhizobium johnstonii]|uniref:hypothetical protein n=1 Tax=Rhizobium johnstonii TaxID=3019933 RepID=UPI003F9C8373